MECSTYANASKASSKTTSATRLTECASVLAFTVKVGVRKLRFKTVKALLEHISQTLPTSDGAYCEPLATDYFKALRTVLEYPPHPEHLLKEDWHDVIDFCNTSVHDLNAFSVGNSSNVFNDSHSFTDLPSRPASPRFHGDRVRNSISHGSELRNSAEDLVFCVRHLTSVTNAPVLEKASVTLSALLDLLESAPNLGTTQQAALESINSIIIRITTNDTALVLQTLRRIVPMIRRFWQGKSSGLKVMLTSLFYGEIYLVRLLRSDEERDFQANLLGLLEVMRVEYCKRTEREQLQLDDIDLSDHSFRLNRHMPLSTKACELRLGAIRAEQPWALLHMSASILVAIHSEAGVDAMPNVNADFDPPPKRQRIGGALDNLLQLTKASRPSEKLYALQALVFVFDKLTLDIGNLEATVHLLLPCASDDNGLIASWAIIALTWCVSHSMITRFNTKLIRLIVPQVRRRRGNQTFEIFGFPFGVLQQGRSPQHSHVELHASSWQSR